MKAQVNWHFPRADIAQTIMDLFETQATSAITLFAPRRMGKTQLLIEDLWPLAESKGYQVRYASFWMDKSNPESVFYNAITSEGQKIDTIRSRVGFSGNYIEATKSFPNHATPSPIDIEKAFLKLCRGRKKTVLLLDEIQQLAMGEDNDKFVTTLRTLLDTNKNKVFVVFTGSSREGLIKMFNRQKAALFNFSHQLELPTLSTGFVKHMLDAFKQASGKTIA